MKLALLKETDLEHLQDLYQRSPDYFQAIGQSQLFPDEARQGWDQLPPGKTYQDRWPLGLWHEGRLEGYLELLRGYPAAEVAYLGLLLVCPARRGQGLAQRLWLAALQRARQWPEIERLRLAVVETHEAAFTFWAHLGFRATGEIKPYILADGHPMQVHLFERDILSGRR